MDWQQSTALAIVGITAALMLGGWLRRRLRTRLGGGCCGCETHVLAARPPVVRFRARKGERAEIRIDPR